MAQQSSTVTTFRAFVMLVCVLLIPLAAVCGTSFPSVVKAIQNGRCPTLADFRGPAEITKNSLSEAPRFVPASTPAANPTFPSTQPGVSAQPFSHTNVADSSVVPVSYEAPIATLLGQPTTFPQNKNAESPDFAAAGNPGLAKLRPDIAILPSAPGGGTPGSAAYVAQPAVGASQVPPNGPSNPDATFKLIQDRLKQLGATYYLLEAWGDQKDAYRFYCRMPIGGNPQVWRPFQNVDPDPLKAMANVLQQIEDWQKRG